jgi:hypothetical protein
MVPAVAVKVVETEPAGTVIDAAGTGSRALLLLRLTEEPPAGADLESVTVHEPAIPDPRVEGEQTREESVAGATRLIEAVREPPLTVAVMMAV